MLQTVMQVSGAVPHHLVLDLLPAEQRPLDEHLVRSGWRRGRRRRSRVELVRVVRDAAARAAERVRRPDDQRAGRSRSRAPRASSTSVHDRAARAPARRSRCSSCWNSSRSSAFWIASSGVPSSRTPYRSRTPGFGAAATARFRPVCPPSVGSRPSGRSRSMIRSSTSTRQRLDVDDVGDVLVGHDRRRVGVDEDDVARPPRAARGRPACRRSRTRRPGR